MPNDRWNRWENSGGYSDLGHPDVGTPDDLADPIETDRYDRVEEARPSFSPNTTKDQLFVQWPALIEDGDL